MDRWDGIECSECGGADVDLAEAIPGPLFKCQECGKRFDPPTDDDKPTCRLVGTDGNVFSVIARVNRCLKRAGQREQAKEWVTAATSSCSYDEVLQRVFDFVDPV